MTPFSTTTPEFSLSSPTTALPSNPRSLLQEDSQLMAPSDPSGSVTHYQILNISPSILSTQHDPSSLIKRAYRRALLQNHPDKATSTQQPKTVGNAYSIDQITEAFNVLASPTERAAYDTSLKLQADPEAQSLVGKKFQTGVENVDLDDLEFDEQDEFWFRSCRCGNDRGYFFTEDDLMEVSDEGELMVGCQDCSLWLRVHFAVLEDDAESQIEGRQPS